MGTAMQALAVDEAGGERVLQWGSWAFCFRLFGSCF
jgi:hypothetical protein